MMNFSSYVQQGSAHAWLFIPTAVVLGILHALEPGHSKTMMAAFIIAVRGTVMQAVLLGVSAAFSHSLLIWLLAGLGLTLGQKWSVESTEPWLQLISAGIILFMAVWLFRRTRREQTEAHEHHHHHHHGHDHQPETIAGPVIADDPAEANGWQQAAHSHSHAAPASPILSTPSGLILPGSAIQAPSALSRTGPHSGMLLDTGHGWLEVAIYEGKDIAPRFRIYPCKASGAAVPLPRGTSVTVETSRLDGRSQRFQFEPGDGFWESTAVLPEPHEFLAVITLGHGDHAHQYRLRFVEDAHHHHPIAVEEPEDDGNEYQDAHERAHAQDIARRFAGKSVTTPQIILFGITGGLMPCPAAVSVLIICLQLKKLVLGFALVLAFSIGLAVTMVTTGVIAAWSVRHAEKRFKGFGEFMRKAPYVSAAVLVLIACYLAWSGWSGLQYPHVHAH